MQLSSKPKTDVWTFPSGAKIPYRFAESLDIEIAEAMAAKDMANVLAAGELMGDYGFTEPSVKEVIAQIGSNVDDTKAHVNHFFAVSLGLRLMQECDGFSLDGELQVKSRRFLSQLFKDITVQRDWLERAQTPLHKAVLAGNA